MAENYKHLYEQTKEMLTMYQDNLIPGFRQKIDELEADNERLRKGWAEAVSAHSKADSLIPRWIPVSERLPEKGKKVLCSGPNGGIFIAGTRYCAGRVLWDDRTRIGRRNVTHWMPLPEPPKEEI